VFPLLKL